VQHEAGRSATTGAIEVGRVAFARGSWSEACERLVSVDIEEVEDLERLAVAAYLVGRDELSAQAWERAHRACLALAPPDADRAARCAFWLALALLLRGDVARAGGWLARAERLVERPGDDVSIGAGFLRVVVFLEALESGDVARARELSDEVVAVGRRHGDADLLALGVLGSGQVALVSGDAARGLKLLDEVMVSVTTGEVSPIPAGIVYCAVIEACMDVFDFRRAAEWTDALHGWCSAQPDMVPYRGQCLVHRSQVLQAHGEWAEALAEAERARRRLSDPAHPAIGLACYQLGDLHRLRGDFAGAERAYREASRHGREPAPGFALLRLAEGDVAAAVVAVRRMVEESRGRPDRAAVLAAAVEVQLAAGEVAAARAAGGELAALAAGIDVPLLQAVAGYAEGRVLLAEGDPGAALVALRPACRLWRELAMPYDVARAQVEIARACRSLGDLDAADLALDAARATFEALAAGPDLARVAGLAGGTRPQGSGSAATVLTAREREVLTLVAAGRTNRDVAAELVISEHTVARHVQNIFTKLGVSSRAAATAFAYRHDLV
jgi:ATP/maltotriose-dependent transcriptional regulator MalT